MTPDERWLRLAVTLSRRCPPSPSAFSVGAVVVSGEQVCSTGYSREEQPADHAEEVALRKLSSTGTVGPSRQLGSATLYSSLEPCSRRASRRRSCTELILAAGLRRVVFAWREPALFIDCNGAELLAEAGVEVVELPELAPLVQAVNAHLLG